MGKGRTVGVELNASTTDQTVTLSYLDNWLFGKRISGGLNLSFQHEQLTTTQDILGPIFDTGVPDPYTSKDDYTNSTNSILTAYKMPYTYWALTLGASGGWSTHTAVGDFGLTTGFSSTYSQNAYDTTMYRPASKDMRENANEWLWTNKIPFRAYLNDLDLWYNPSKGFYASQRLTWAGLTPESWNWEAQHYLRSDTRLDLFATLFSIPVFEGWNFKWVLGGHSALSAIVKQPLVGNDLQVLASDDLRIDGTFIGRGWRTLYDVEDGRALWDNWLELRMPILEQYFWLDGFIDADVLQTENGLLQITGSSAAIESGTTLLNLGLDNLILSTGIGLRFTINQFPFRFYFVKRFCIEDGQLNFTPAGTDGSWGFVISMTQSLN